MGWSQVKRVTQRVSLSLAQTVSHKNAALDVKRATFGLLPAGVRLQTVANAILGHFEVIAKAHTHTRFQKWTDKRHCELFSIVSESHELSLSDQFMLLHLTIGLLCDAVCATKVTNVVI